MVPNLSVFVAAQDDGEPSLITIATILTIKIEESTRLLFRLMNPDTYLKVSQSDNVF